MAVLRTDGSASADKPAGRSTTLVRTVARAALLCGTLIAAWLTAGAAPALALSQRGHEFSFSFATQGPPAGVAVDEASGHVYVARHGASGQTNCTLGCVDEYELISASEQKLIRVLAVPDPSSIAVDNSATSPSKGDVYVAGTTRKAAREEEEEANTIYKFGPTGEAPIARLKNFKIGKGEPEKFAEQPIIGLAVNSAGDLFAYTTEGLIARFGNQEKNKPLFSIEVTVTGPPGSAERLEAAPGLAVDPEGKFYFGRVPEKEGAEGRVPVIGKCEIEEAECPAVNEELDQQRSTAVAADKIGNAFVDNVYTTVKEGKREKKSEVTAFNSSGAQIQRFTAPGLVEPNGVAVDSGRETVYVTDGATNTVYVFGLEQAGAPVIDSTFACITTQCSPPAHGARLVAEVDPRGNATTGFFEYGPESCEHSSCAKTQEVSLENGFADRRLEAEPAELQPGTAYHFRAVARNDKGQEVKSREGIFTLPQPGPTLLDSRAWEMVSPPEKHGLEAEPILGSGGVIQAAADGGAITYIADGPVHTEGQPEGSRSPEPAQIFAVRGSTGWSARDLATPPGEGRGANVGLPREYEAFTPNLALSLLTPYPGAANASQWEIPPLSPPVSNHERELAKMEKPYQEKTVYLHNDASLQPEAGNAAQEAAYRTAEANGLAFGKAGFLPLVTQANSLGILNPITVTGTVTKGSKILSSVVSETGLNPTAEIIKSPGNEKVSAGIPAGTTLVKQLKPGEWEMSSEAEESHEAEPIQVYVPFGGGELRNTESLGAAPDLTHGVVRVKKGATGLYEWEQPAQPESQPKLQLVSGLPQFAIGTVSAHSNVITSLLGSGLAPGVEILAGEGIPSGTKLVREIKSGEWEISAEATESHSGDHLTVFARATEPRLGGDNNRRHAISNSGSRVFWENKLGGNDVHLYVRDTQTHETLQLDLPEAEAGAGEPTAAFQIANAEGTRVFFTDTQRLTTNSKAVTTSVKPDLYVYELPPPGAPLAGAKGLRDLTPEGIYGESAAIVGFMNAGGVLGASEDGSYVYFVANGALTPGSKPGRCEAGPAVSAPQQSCNLYVVHKGSEWEAPTLIAVLSHDDNPDWGLAGVGGAPNAITSRVSPNGRYLAFMSERSLTGYNNEDATSKAAVAKGEPPRFDEEVFQYDNAQKTIVCVSCNPSGAPPQGVLDPGKARVQEGGEGIGLIVDRIGVWGLTETRSDHWLAGSVPGSTGIAFFTALYQSRYLLDNGRMFFNSPDHLVADATGTKGKVYEYEPNGLGGCHSAGGCIGLLSSGNSQGEEGGEHESAFLDASESGNDVFFLTAARLPQVNGTSPDVDTNFDLYDARVCQQGGASSCLPGPPPGSAGCHGETECKGPAPGVTLPPPPGSMTASASGNVAHIEVRGSTESSKPKTSAKPLSKLAKALKQCRSKYKGNKKKKQRASCEARARKKYAHSTKHSRAKRAVRSVAVGGRK